MKNKITRSALLTLSVLPLSACMCFGQTVSFAADAETTLEAAEETENTAETAAADTAERGTGDIYTSSENESHAITADGEEASYDNVKVEKTGDSNQNDESDFYGTNAAVFATNGATLTLSNSYITTDGGHANAVFSYGEGTTLNISDSTIETSKNNSGGVMVTGGGTLNAANVDVTTQGGSSAAIRSDRGGGNLNVTGGSFKSYGAGSPAIYSTANITVSDAELYSDVSQAVVVEGKNSVTLTNTDATGNNTVQNSDNSTREQAVMIYQSMSGDASEGQGTFTMTGGSLTSLNEGMFFVTNTVAEINLENVTLNYASDDLLRIEAAGWGSEGSNGGQVTLNANDQALEGIITVDDISSLNLILNGSSSFEGSFDNSGEVYVELNDNATWKLTGDSSITGLTCSENAIDLNGFTLTVDGTEYVAGTASTGTAIEVTVSESTGSGDQMAPPSGDNGNAPSGDGSNPPEKPDGDGSAPSNDNGNPPAKPDGDSSNAPSGDNGNPPEKPDGDSSNAPSGDNGNAPQDNPENGETTSSAL